MLLKQTITSVAESDPALDQAQLFALGLNDVRRFSRLLWTDHNLHDPGITILELLCYALTDLSYRAQHPLEDLLTTPSGNAQDMTSQFFTAGRVLPNRPLTAIDYRKLLIDLPGVRNAWIGPAPLHYFADTVAKKLVREGPATNTKRQVDIHGLYRVRIEYMDDKNTQAERQQVHRDVLELLRANRNLCEDFVAVEGVETQLYSLCAELELTPGADPIEVAAQIRFQVDRYLAPPICNYRLAEMLDKRHEDGGAYTVEEIFDGPRLKNGFLDTEEVARAELRTEVRLSDIISVIMDITGVLAVRDIVVNQLETQPDGTLVKPVKAIEPQNKWRLPVPDGKQPRLADEHGRLVFYKRNLPLQPDQDQVNTRLAKLKQEQRARLKAPDVEEDVLIPPGRDRNPARYHSFQHHFPVVYGLSGSGLPSNASKLRRAQLLQLKGYLLFFDQVLANYLAQLSQVSRLFSRDSATAVQTYFAQVVDSIPRYKDVYSATVVNDAALPSLETGAAARARRNRFLDHLLARIAEDFHHYVSIVRTTFGESEQKVINTKCAFLNDYPQLGGERGLAYDDSLTKPDELWNSGNVSGLERRLARLLGIDDFSRRNLATVSYDTYAEIDQTPNDEFRFRVKHRVSGKILLSSSTNYATPEAARAEMEQAITRGQSLDGYERKNSADGKHYVNIVDATGEVLARRIEYFETAEELEAVIVELATYLREHYSGEGMYLIENILLRLQNNDDDDLFLPICVDSACTDCADDDPYSYRLHFVLPAYAGRFQNMDFRRYVEETIRLETPAHILPKICWVDADQMAKFEQAYRDWVSLHAGATHANRQQKLKAFRDALVEIKNVYPKQKLRDCGGGDKEPPFVLGLTQLGSSD